MLSMVLLLLLFCSGKNRGPGFRAQENTELQLETTRHYAFQDRMTSSVMPISCASSAILAHEPTKWLRT